MKHLILLLTIIAIFSLVFISGCFKEIPIDEVTSCESDIDCVQVYTAGCCKCPFAINKDYQDYWDELSKRESKNCEAADCMICPIRNPLGITCANNTCKLIISWVYNQ